MPDRVSRRPHSDMQIFIDGQLGKYSPILRDVAYRRRRRECGRRAEQVMRRRASLMPDDGAALDGHLSGNAVHKRGFAHARQANNARTDALREIDIHVP